jgi:hypothetical protein
MKYIFNFLRHGHIQNQNKHYYGSEIDKQNTNYSHELNTSMSLK